MIGQGKYDREAAEVRIKIKAAGVLLIVIDGEIGSGFSAQLPMHMAGAIPSTLRTVADQIEADMAKARKQ